MRPPAFPQSALRAPLNTLMGTEANVRLLRLLTQTTEPVSGTQLAREARLSAPGTYGALNALRSSGVVERVGRGARGQFRLRRDHPLAPTLVSLFDAERARVDRLFQALRAAAQRLSPAPRSVWLYGPAAEGTDQPGDTLCIAVVAAPKHVSDLADRLRDQLGDLEAQQDVTIEVRGLTEADLDALPQAERVTLARSVVLGGLPPDAHFRTGRAGRRAGRRGDRDHRYHDQALLRLAHLIAGKLERDPALVERARRYIRSRSAAASAGERRELLEWDRILRVMSLPRLREFLVDPGPRATRLRQTLPFFDAVSPEEREAVFGASGT